MTQPKIREHNIETGKIVDRDLTVDELAQWEADKAAVIAAQQAEATTAAEKTALLARLGITADEAKLLLS